MSQYVTAHGIFPMVQECVWRELHLNQFSVLIGKIYLFVS